MPKNQKIKKLTIYDLPKNLPDYKNSELSKDRITAKWLCDWVKSAKKNHLINSGDILPSKKVISEYLKISIGTVENAIRFLEDDGFLESKQRIGTFIPFDLSKTQKQTSKREVAINRIEKYICQNKIGHIMPSVSKMSAIIKMTKNTVRLAYIYLEKKNILASSKNKQKNVLEIINFPKKDDSKETCETSLLEKISDEIFNYLKNNFNKGDKINTREELAKRFGVSIKTIHDSLKILEAKGIVLSRRGKYGTILINKEENTFQPTNEHSIFAKAKNAVNYRWEKIEKRIKSLIKEFYEVGSKLPSMEALSENFDVSTNTIRQALKNLSKEGWVEFERGRYGGTFVLNIPDITEQSTYEWLAVSQNFTNQKSSF